MKEVEIDAAKVRIEFSPRYMNEVDCVFNENTPMLKDGVFSITYDIETGVVDGWPKDESFECYEKVTDGGSYYLLDSEGVEIASIVENYVPDCVNNEWGDYVIIKINDDGILENLRPASSASCFFNSDED
eukprot:GHVR01040583.1.p4 GENE.GHVR01040583.1~~GHVR01040583.1.p4  ORF type:complete len:138 (+),score=15.24 GHVR01040583.1:25-414(+)